MDFELSKLIVPAITGLATGALGSLIAPWINWGIEKKKLKRQNREALIERVRGILDEEDLANTYFMHTPEYASIKPYLSPMAIKDVEGDPSDNDQFMTETITLVEGYGRMSGVNPFKNQVLDELVLLEKKWELI